MEDYDGQRVTVMGLGRFGGGLGVSRWLVGQGAQVLVTDLADESALAGPLEALAPLVDRGLIELRLSGHNISDFTTCDLVVANPAVPKPWENRFLRAAHAAGIAVTTEIGLVVERLSASGGRKRLIGVTGSNGKSTTSAMIAHALGSVRDRVSLGGNIGGSLLDRIDSIEIDEPVVLELSSAQLHWLAGVSPHLAVVTNFAPNHLDWHGSVAHYRVSKQAMLQHQRPGDVAVASDSIDWPAATGVARVGPDAIASTLAIPGMHNLRNAQLALAAAVAFAGTEHRTTMADALSTFESLPHRLERVDSVSGILFFNDSKSTTPEATVTALGALTERTGTGRMFLIAGGYDKGIDLTPIVEVAGELAVRTTVVTIGQTGNAIAALAGQHGVEAIIAETLARAFESIMAIARPGDTVLLSPGCASWDQFINFEARGALFRQLVMTHDTTLSGSAS